MRRVGTLVLPVPAPATIRSGPWSWVTASIWAGFSSSRIRRAAGSGCSEVTAGGCGESAARDTADLSARQRPGQARGPPRTVAEHRGRWAARPGEGSALPAVDRREPGAVGRLLAPDHREVAGLDRLRQWTRLDAVPEGQAVDRHHRRDLPPTATQKRLVRDI